MSPEAGPAPASAAGTAGGRGASGFSPPPRRRTDLWWTLLLAVIAWLPSLSYFLRGDTLLGFYPIGRDEDLSQWMIYRHFIGQALRQGKLPTWTPQLDCGLPFIGWPHTSVFAPLGLIYNLLPYNTAAVVGFFLHLMIFSISLYVLLRSLGQRPFAAWCGAVVGHGFFIINGGNHFLPWLLTFSWTPLLFAAAVGLWRTRRAAYFAGMGAVLCLQIFGGHLELVMREFLFLVLLALAVLVFQPRELIARRGALLLLAVAAAGGCMMALVQLLPSAEFAHMSIRSDPEWFSYQLYVMNAGPYHFANYAHKILGPVILAAAWLSWRDPSRRPWVRAMALTALACLFLATNTFNLLKLTYHVPFLDRMMWHHYMLMYIEILLAIAVGMAVERAGEAEDLSRPALVLAAAAILCGLFFGWERLTSDLTTHPNLNYINAGTLDRTFYLFIALGVLGAALVISGRGSQRRYAAWFTGLLLLTHFLPSFFSLPRTSGDFPAFNPAYLSFFSHQPLAGRTITFAPEGHWDDLSIPFQVGYVPGNEAVDAIVTSPVRWYAEFYSLLNHASPGQQGGQAIWLKLWLLKNEPFVSRETLHLINLLNLAYVVCEETNLKFSSNYYLSYYWTPRSCRGGPCFRPGSWKRGDTPEVAMQTPAQWSQVVHVPEHARLEWGLAVWDSGPGRAVPVAVEATAEAEGGTRPRLLFCRTIEPGAEVLHPAVDLARFADATVTLNLRAWPAAGPPGGPAPELAWVNPYIYNPDAYFKRLPVKGVNIFFNTGVLSRAFVVHRWRVVPDRKQRLAYIADPARFDPSREVVLESSPGPMDEPRDSGSEPVSVLLYQPDRIVLSVEMRQEGFLVLSDVYYPGWSATDRDEPARILRADHAFRALRLAAGTHRIVFTYRPPSIRIGLWASITGGLVLVLALTMIIITTVKNSRSGPVF